MNKIKKFFKTNKEVFEVSGIVAFIAAAVSVVMQWPVVDIVLISVGIQLAMAFGYKR